MGVRRNTVSPAAIAGGLQRILVHDYAGHPFQVQLSRELARRGHRVLHLHSTSLQTPKGRIEPRADDPPEFEVDGITLDAPFRKYDFLVRRRQEKGYGRLLAARVDAWRPTVVVAANTPLDILAILQDRCSARSVGFVFWAQDLYGVAIDRILSRRLPILGHLVGHHYVRLERQLARHSHAVVLVTEDFLPIFRGWDVPESRLWVIENWAPLDEIQPKRRDNDWAKQRDLVGKFCMLYSGTLGLKHNPDLLIKLAVHFRERSEVRVVVVSEGLGADWLRQRKKGLRLDNLSLFPYQPYERLPDVLATGDVLLAILEPDAGIFSVPSKVLTCLCVGRPVLAAFPPENLAARILSRHQTGLVVHPSDVEGFLNAAEELLNDGSLREKLAENALTYASEHFDIDKIGTRFEGVISRAVAASATN